MRKLIGFIALVAMSAALVNADPYNCSGSTQCADGCVASCSLSGSVEGATSCVTFATPDSISCKVKQGVTIIAQTETLCDCSGGGGGGSGGTGTTCDPTIPLYWLYCDPFAM